MEPPLDCDPPIFGKKLKMIFSKYSINPSFDDAASDLDKYILSAAAIKIDVSSLLRLTNYYLVSKIASFDMISPCPVSILLARLLQILQDL